MKNESAAFIVMGVCGVGKTSISRSAAKRFGATYIEADDFHTVENITAMNNGVPLSDGMRKPWLFGLSHATENARQNGIVLVACSALKRSYRDLITSIVSNAHFICLIGERDLIAKRLEERSDHFMSASLLDSQIATLEMPDADESFATIDVAGTHEQVLYLIENEIREYLQT